MFAKETFQIREAALEEDGLIAEHFYQLWRDNRVPETAIAPDWQTITIQFIQQARQNLQYKAFVAEVDHQVIGSVGGQIFSGLYPLALAPHYRQYGYIWGVYVEANFRRQGVGKQLTQAMAAYLRSLGCTRAILHASPTGRSVYQSLGFVESNEMQLDLN